MSNFKRKLANGENVEIPAVTLRRWKRLRYLNLQQFKDQCEIRGPEVNSGGDSETMEENSEMSSEEVIDSDTQSEAPSVTCSEFSDVTPNYSDNDYSENESDNEFQPNQTDNDHWMNREIYNGSDKTLGTAMYKILNYFFTNNSTKKGLYDLLDLIQYFLPQENNLPKNKYSLMKILDKIIPYGNQTFKKHRLCENCSNYLGIYTETHKMTTCNICQSKKINGIFVEYDLKSLLKHSLEKRNLGNLILEHKRDSEHDPNYVSDVTSGLKYRSLKRDVIKGDYDICSIWNTDGLPVANSSNGQVWLVQIKVVNIPPQKRRNFQFVCGIYYSREKKPCMTSFLKPFVDLLIQLHGSGIDWYDESSSINRQSIMIAPVASLDAQARAPAQNINQYNGKFGCSFCEHSGIRCPAGAGFARIYPPDVEQPTLRTAKNMLLQAYEATTQGVDQIKGVKGPSIAALIPCFDVAKSFVPDYMHSILLGVFRMLTMELWFNTKNKSESFYVGKFQRDKIDRELKKIFPPDYVTRTPRILKYIKYWKASELRECLLHYFPIILKGKLRKKYYEHFLILVHATTLSLKSKIHFREIDVIEHLFNLFVMGVERLYGRRRCSFNVHQLTHIASSIRLFGPIWAWSAFSFEDENGYVKKFIHGSNKIEMEITNTTYILNCYKILKYKLNMISQKNDYTNVQTLGKPMHIELNVDVQEAIQNYFSSLDFEITDVKIYARIKLDDTIFTSEYYLRQKVRNNFNVFWNDCMYGRVLVYVSMQEQLYAVVRQLVEFRNRENRIMIRDLEIDLSAYIVPVRDTHSIHVVPIKNVRGKFLNVHDFMCVPPNNYEKK